MSQSSQQLSEVRQFQGNIVCCSSLTCQNALTVAVMITYKLKYVDSAPKGTVTTLIY